MIVPIIMAGGSGTRLWPMSRSLYPKQFLPLVNEKTMLEDTCQRLDGLGIEAPIVVCGEDHRFTVAEQLRAMPGCDASSIILEPAGRNTAPAIALAALQVQKSFPAEDAMLLVLAADHSMSDVKAFHEAVDIAASYAESGKLMTFGIVPTGPETGYGYIKTGSQSPNGAFDVDEFVEKPDLSTAEKYVGAGTYLWNSGMFLFKASAYLNALKTYRPDIFSACETSMSSAKEDMDFVRPEKSAFLACSDESVDYAVMEKTSDAMVVPLSCGWSDVGSWSALWEVAEKDESGNALYGDVILTSTKNSYVRSDSKLIATVGVENLVVVETDDAIMVADKGAVQNVKDIVSHLKAEGRSETKLHRKVYRPWGYYDSIDFGARFQVKRIVVKPGGKLSLQKHHHRAEHWIVVSGTAQVTRGEEVFLVTENESTYIPLGTTHRLENPGTIALEMIEVQSGSYLGEDDIVRYEDTYGRD